MGFFAALGFFAAGFFAGFFAVAGFFAGFFAAAFGFGFFAAGDFLSASPSLSLSAVLAGSIRLGGQAVLRPPLEHAGQEQERGRWWWLCGRLDAMLLPESCPRPFRFLAVEPVQLRERRCVC